MSPSIGGQIERALVRAVPAAWLLAFVAAPLAIVARISVSETAVAQPPYRPQVPAAADPSAWLAFARALGFDNYRTLASEPIYAEAALTSLAVAGLSTALIALIAYPLALALARAPARWRPVLLAAVIVPFWTSFLVRIYALIAILKDEGWLHQLLAALGLAHGSLGILNTNAAVIVGCVYAYLPFMVLPLYAALVGLDPALDEAASDLGANAATRFWTVTLPATRGGLGAGALLCFVPIAGEFVIPDLLGGSETLMLGRLLWSEFFTNRDWPLASAIAVVLLVVFVVPAAALQRRRLGRAR